MLQNNDSYCVWKLYLEMSYEKNIVYAIPEIGDRFLIEEIYIYNNYFYIVALNLDNIGIGNGTVDEFPVKGDAIIYKNPDQNKDLRGELCSSNVE
jgi:hypothetical protein